MTGEGETLVLCKRPNQSRDRGKDVENGEEQDDGRHRHKKVGRRLGFGGFIKDLDKRHTSRVQRSRDFVNVADGVEQTDDERKQHNRIDHG